MLVYADRREPAVPRELARDIDRRLQRAARTAPGLDRHARMVDALVQAGKLLQGIADADFADAGCDRRTLAADGLGDFLLQLGTCVCRSWSSGFQTIGALPRLQPAADWPPSVELRVPEGFAFYAVYPEAYAEAARRLRLDAAPRVIGIRSIGTSLAAVVAASLGAPPPVTVRPFGDPYARRIAVDPALECELLHGDAHYVIVDEGPGQSGSSFGAVADWLQEHGVVPERIAAVPSHDGPPGPAASEQRRRWWKRVQREAGDFGRGWPALIERWFASVVGPPDDAPRDLSGGEWRRLHHLPDEDWPAVVPASERRKFLLSAGGNRFLVKFAGLGGIGEDKLAIARTLSAEGLVPEPLDLIHGFLVERWKSEARPLGAGDRPLREVARYIGIRARLLPGGSGASVDELLAMAERNVSLELGAATARALDLWAGRARDLDRRVVRVRTDNKLDRHEWLRGSVGGLIKTDALDHHQAHDLIGCQDLAWDVAGAIAEFDVRQNERERFIASVEDSTGRRVDCELLEFCRIAYCAFRVGSARMGAATTGDERERRRIDSAADRYAAQLRHLLEHASSETRPKSLVG